MTRDGIHVRLVLLMEVADLPRLAISGVVQVDDVIMKVQERVPEKGLDVEP